MIGIEHLVWGGGKESNPGGYVTGGGWLNNQRHLTKFGVDDGTVDILQRFYSGANNAIGAGYNPYRGYYIILGTYVLGQLGDSVYMIVPYSNPIRYYTPPTDESYYDKYEYIKFSEAEDHFIWDYLPESWIAHLNSLITNNVYKNLCIFNHNDLVADGIEQS